MTGSTPSRGRRIRRQGSPGSREERAGREAPAGTAQAPAEQDALPADPAGRPDQAPGTALSPRPERGRTASLVAAAGRGAARGGRGLRGGLALVSDRIIDTAPRVPVRDLAALRRQFPGLDAEELADKLVAGAVRASSAVGASVGAAAMLPAPPAMPAELAAEIVGVASVEYKLIAELHEVYGIRAPGNATQRAYAYLSAWTEQRGIDVAATADVSSLLGAQMRRRLRNQVLKRTVRNFPTLVPFMIGAAAGAVMNRRETAALAAKIRQDLRRRQVPWDQLPPGPAPEPGSPKSLQGPDGRSPEDGTTPGDGLPGTAG
ncbi:hypothetical protein [Streptomyces xinghaiensis]|uniref:hypothetical protein n=1 Tax=Streptomyces xinghaiensis TaxID=1038928 RepID=UPI001EDD495C|nr:hypothetical protein [Streptomyces xinghaiensis]